MVQKEQESRQVFGVLRRRRRRYRGTEGSEGALTLHSPRALSRPQVPLNNNFDR